jgi:hypothetical protein
VEDVQPDWADPPLPLIDGLDLVGGFAVLFDLLSSEYGWTDDQIQDLPLRALRQKCAAIALRHHHRHLQQRRLATAQLRTVCAYIAATIDVAEGAENVMLSAAADINLGPGTENVHTPAAGPSGPPVGRQRPAAVVDVEQLPDAPPGVRAGAPAPAGTGGQIVRELPLEMVGNLFGGGL